jgi:hypothetical protein
VLAGDSACGMADAAQELLGPARLEARFELASVLLLRERRPALGAR